MTTIDHLEVAAYEVPTDVNEADGTLSWDATTIVVVHAHAGPVTGVGFTYADRSAATLVSSKLASVVRGRAADAPRSVWEAMVTAIRNDGRPGIASNAIAAVDLALWDLHARLLEVSLAELIGTCRDAVPVYGSGGFTSYSDERLREQLGGWVRDGIPRVKMKIEGDPQRAVERAVVARTAIGEDVELFVDANGAYTPRSAVAVAERLVAEADISWLEEPVSSDDLAGLAFVRNHAPAQVEVAAGEYGYDAPYFARMLQAQAVDVLQADVTRCGGITGLLMADAQCYAVGVPLSLHCSPAMHAHPGCGLLSLRHLEYFHDHVRIEAMLFDGTPEQHDGCLSPNRNRVGNGLTLNREAAALYVVDRT